MMPHAAPFDAQRHRLLRGRAAADFASASFLKIAMADRIADRIADINRRFSRALDLGCHQGWPAQPVAEHMISCDVSPQMLAGANPPKLVADPEHLPFAGGSFDLVVSAGALHWINDLPGCLVQLREALVPDGFFIATLIGGDSLQELRAALLQAEIDICGGAQARIAPMVDVRAGGGLLQRAGFAMPVADIDRLTVTYADPLALLKDLRAMGETSALAGSAPLRRDVLARMCALYEARHAGPDGRVPATFTFVTLSGWSPAPDQPRPLRPGSASMALAEALGKPPPQAR